MLSITYAPQNRQGSHVNQQGHIQACSSVLLRDENWARAWLKVILEENRQKKITSGSGGRETVVQYPRLTLYFILLTETEGTWLQS